MKNRKVIFDTNIWISFLISKDFSFIDKYIESGKIKLIFSEELFNEFISVSQRPKFKKYFSKGDLDLLTDLIHNFGSLVRVQSNVKHCRDIKDNFLLNLAIDSEADYLITGDSDLLELKTIANTKILTIREFIEDINR